MLDKRITLQKLEVFQLVVELEGVTRAADRLHVAQPVVSAHLRSLEARLGAQLFYREGHRLHLTQAGRAAHRWASEIQRGTRELARELEGLSDGARGSIAIGSSMSIGSYELPDLVIDFRRRHPLVEIRIELPEVNRAIAGTESGENDFSIVAMTQEPVLESLRSEFIGYSPMTIVAPPTGVVDDSTVTIEQLAGLPWVEAPRGFARRGFIDTQLAKLGLHDRTVAIEFGHPESIKKGVAGGLGLALLFRSAVARELEDGSLREIHVDGHEINGRVHLLHRKDKVFPPVQHRLVEEIKQHFAAGSRVPTGEAATAAH